MGPGGRRLLDLQTQPRFRQRWRISGRELCPWNPTAAAWTSARFPEGCFKKEMTSINRSIYHWCVMSQCGCHVLYSCFFVACPPNSCWFNFHFSATCQVHDRLVETQHRWHQGLGGWGTGADLFQQAPTTLQLSVIPRGCASWINASLELHVCVNPRKMAHNFRIGHPF